MHFRTTERPYQTDISIGTNSEAYQINSKLFGKTEGGKAGIFGAVRSRGLECERLSTGAVEVVETKRRRPSMTRDVTASTLATSFVAAQ